MKALYILVVHRAYCRAILIFFATIILGPTDASTLPRLNFSPIHKSEILRTTYRSSIYNTCCYQHQQRDVHRFFVGDDGLSQFGGVDQKIDIHYTRYHFERAPNFLLEVVMPIEVCVANNK